MFILLSHTVATIRIASFICAEYRQKINIAISTETSSTMDAYCAKTCIYIQINRHTSTNG